jgi:uncharacterized damage-inducible protein DinB
VKVHQRQPEQHIKQSIQLCADVAELSTERVRTDADISTWAAGVEQAWLDQDLVWVVSGTQREIRRPRRLAMTHFFNHQTHHRGKVHAVLTYFGHDPGDTDLPLVLPQM